MLQLDKVLTKHQHSGTLVPVKTGEKGMHDSKVWIKRSRPRDRERKDRPMPLACAGKVGRSPERLVLFEIRKPGDLPTSI